MPVISESRGLDVGLPVTRLPAVALGLGVLAALLWLGNPALALLAGVALTLVLDRQPLPDAAPLARFGLQSAIVLLGLKLDLGMLWQLSAQYLVLVAGYVVSTLVLGLTLGRLLAVEGPSSKLVSAGTAICGGTAIASLSTVVRAQPGQTGVALGVVFLLNMLALLTFPWIGHALGLSDVQFGLWAALAIHDTSSVVAAASAFSDHALEVATTIKLGRTLWLIPVVFALTLWEQRQRPAAADEAAPRLPIPWFALLFVAAAAVGSLIEPVPALTHAAGTASKALLVVALFLIGAALTRDTVRRIRGRVLWQALGLWLLVAPLSLAAVMYLA